MNKVSFVFLALAGLWLNLHEAHAQQYTPSLERLAITGDGASRWALESSLTFPLVRIYMMKLSFEHSDRVELGMGMAFQNWRNTDQKPMGQSHAITLLLSYRYYFWRNIHLEIELWPAWNRFESDVDGKTYRGLELWNEYKAGYRIDMGSRFYTVLQPGVGHGVWLQNPWPDVNYDNYWQFVRDSVIFVPQVLVGMRL